MVLPVLWSRRTTLIRRSYGPVLYPIVDRLTGHVQMRGIVKKTIAVDLASDSSSRDRASGLARKSVGA